MKFILFVIDDQLEKAPANEMADIDAFNDRLEAEELAAAGSKACNRKVELRPFIG